MHVGQKIDPHLQLHKRVLIWRWEQQLPCGTGGPKPMKTPFSEPSLGNGCCVKEDSSLPASLRNPDVTSPTQMLLPNSTSLRPAFFICWLPWLHTPCVRVASCPAETSGMPGGLSGRRWASHPNSWDCSWEVAVSLCPDYGRAQFSVL